MKRIRTVINFFIIEITLFAILNIIFTFLERTIFSGIVYDDVFILIALYIKKTTMIIGIIVNYYNFATDLFYLFSNGIIENKFQFAITIIYFITVDIMIYYLLFKFAKKDKINILLVPFLGLLLFKIINIFYFYFTYNII